MNFVNINSRNFNVTSYNSDTRPFEFKIYINDLNIIQKEVKIKEKIHKTDIFGNRLYSLNINGRSVEITDENEKYLNGEPIFITNKKNKIIKLKDNPAEFTLNDILKYKKKEILKEYEEEFTNCELYEVQLEKIVDKNYENNNCDTGFKLINIKSNGEVKLHFDFEKNDITKIKLNISNLKVKFSINNGEFIDYNDIILSDNIIKSLDLILINNTDNNIKVNNVYIITN